MYAGNPVDIKKFTVLKMRCAAACPERKSKRLLVRKLGRRAAHPGVTNASI